MGAYSILESGRPIVFFDSSCLLCNKSVEVLLRIDKKKIFTVAALSSEAGVYMQSVFTIEVDSIVLFYEGNCRTKSNAILHISNLLGFPYSVTSIFYIFPKFSRDWIYDIIANNRKKWFGIADHCLIDSEKYSGRIIL
jgi:predicted DCC family thiol-disulfide oxidoreductase YuxK